LASHPQIAWANLHVRRNDREQEVVKLNSEVPAWDERTKDAED
jgi:hypothetical protein